ncbi:CRISPR system Cascade subunit CasB [Actinacidiphila alni]|uniref:CRISPR system Cascade subunit CasB n=1 Tax=Actinacidiphila alni TaxID=380248 RepID=A0A1I1ZB60_9ACTN|nr:type I-E CRISPR-associated protein Cse2/CasB [Actinacidiphila alni]SFE28925.1 CRISPR system Cascade subunit CasB [Actinacidiphila alni]
MTATVPTPFHTRGYGLVGTAADRCIRRLQRGYRDDRPSAVATVARLRRGVGRPAYDVQDLWGLTGTEDLALVMAEAAAGPVPPPDQERADEALTMAITLWALHQQSHRDTDTHVFGYGLGRSVRLLTAPAVTTQEDGSATQPRARTSSAEPDIDEAIRRRFVRIGTATTLDVLAQRLRETVLLLRKAAIPLDYALLADQLYRWQRPAAQADVRRTWGRDFHMAAVVPGRRTPKD